jgi:hypothetical protein
MHVLLINNFNKPLQPISKYKVSDLERMASQLNLNINKKTNKTEIYSILETKLLASLTDL